VTPIRFGPLTRQLFGVVQSPEGTAWRSHTVLLCNPFGQEAIRCHRLLRVLAQRLVRAGFHVMRFDYFATGDSDGDDAQADLDIWVDDVLRASDEALRVSGNPRCSWFGIRLGATLAALASRLTPSRAAPTPELLVLWDPVLHGPNYLTELVAAQQAELKVLHGNPLKNYPELSGPNVTELLGFPLPAPFLSQLQSISGEAFSNLCADKVRLITGPGAQDTAGLISSLNQQGLTVDKQVIDTHIVWASDEAMNTAIVPTEPLQAIVQAFVEGINP
jgi:uncharacterized protein